MRSEVYSELDSFSPLYRYGITWVTAVFQKLAPLPYCYYYYHSDDPTNNDHASEQPTSGASRQCWCSCRCWSCTSMAITSYVLFPSSSLALLTDILLSIGISRTSKVCPSPLTKLRQWSSSATRTEFLITLRPAHLCIHNTDQSNG